MRLKHQRFEDLVQQNKQELMENDKKIEQIENRLEKRFSRHTSVKEQDDETLNIS
ncbi:hypothetical protein GCM10008983_25120 [Lentibacillus halophilus]|uniref:FbpB family small basic protein n=1 Tax=Lentibacillus halophilus TaxID=295065 RepID=A0ABN0ZFS4_9BACI